MKTQCVLRVKEIAYSLRVYGLSTALANRLPVDDQSGTSQTQSHSVSRAERAFYFQIGFGKLFRLVFCFFI